MIKRLLKKVSIIIPDRQYLQLKYYNRMHKKLNLKKPKTFNEKINWLKLYNRKPIYTTMVDKYEAKKYVANIIGEEYIIPTIGIYDHFDDIDFSKLQTQFVIKCTHDSGGLVICKDKSKLDINKAREKINQSLKTNYFYSGREWPYKNVKPRILIEKYMEDEETSELRDYKFFCFDGKAKLFFIATDRQNEHKETCFDFFDMNGKHLNIKNGHPNAEKVPQLPKNFKKMVELSEKISKGIPVLRVDWYEVNGKTFFGELTFSHFSGFVPFEPEEWDLKLGSMINLPKQKNE